MQLLPTGCWWEAELRAALPFSPAALRGSTRLWRWPCSVWAGSERSDGRRGAGLQPDRGAEGCEGQIPTAHQEVRMWVAVTPRWHGVCVCVCVRAGGEGHGMGFLGACGVLCCASVVCSGCCQRFGSQDEPISYCYSINIQNFSSSFEVLFVDVMPLFFSFLRFGSHSRCAVSMGSHLCCFHSWGCTEPHSLFSNAVFLWCFCWSLCYVEVSLEIF